MKDKDKLIIVWYLYIGGMSKSCVIEHYVKCKHEMDSIFDDSIKTIIIPSETEDKIEVINPKYIQATKEEIDRINEIQANAKQTIERYMQKLQEFRNNGLS